MQVSEVTALPQAHTQSREEERPVRKPGTIPVTVRLDPLRYDRLKRLVRRLSITGQSIIQTALDRSMLTLERERAPRLEIEGQSTLFAPVIAIETSMAQRPKQDSFPFIRPEPTVALTYRATVPMHRWLHRRAHETGMTIQEIINDALKAAKGAD